MTFQESRVRRLSTSNRARTISMRLFARVRPHSRRETRRRIVSIRPRASVRVLARNASHRALCSSNRSRALTSNEMSLICERKITFVSHSFASRSHLRRDALRPNVRALIHRASDPNTPSVRSPSRRHALDARRRDARARSERLTSTSSNVHLPKSLISCVVAMLSASHRGGSHSHRARNGSGWRGGESSMEIYSLTVYPYGMS